MTKPLSNVTQTTSASNSEDKVQQAKLDTLTSLRFFAAAMIVVYHMNGVFGIPADFTGHIVLSSGVSFFFILSGFIMTYVYPDYDRLNKRRFFVARIARIWPLQVITVLLTFQYTYGNAMSSWPTTERLGVTLSEVTLTHAWLTDTRYISIFDIPSWSLSVELFFYLSFPILLWKWRKTWWWKIALSLLVVVGLASLRSLPGHAGLDTSNLLYRFPLSRLFEFTLGIATCQVWRVLRLKITVTKWAGTALEFLSLLFTGYALINAYDWAIHVTRGNTVGVGSYVWLANTGFVCIPFAALIAIMAFGAGWISRLLSTSLLVLLGEISFSIYMFHDIVLEFIALQTQFYTRFSYHMLWLLYIVLVLLVSYCSWAFLEMPGRQLILALHNWQTKRGGKITIGDVQRRRFPIAILESLKRGGRSWLVTPKSIGLVLLAIVSIWLLLLSAEPSFSGRERTDKGVAFHFDINNGEISADGATVITRHYIDNETLIFTGWIIDVQNQRLARAVYVVIDNHLQYVGTYGIARPDVSKYFSNPNYEHSGFAVQVPLKSIQSGEHIVTLRVVTNDARTYYESKKFGLRIDG